MAATTKWSICDNSNKWSIGVKKKKPKKSNWTICGTDKKWSIGKNKS